MDRGLTCRELVTDYLEGALPAGERERFEAHMAACEGCGAYVEQVRRTIELTGRTRALEEGRNPVASGIRPPCANRWST